MGASWAARCPEGVYGRSPRAILLTPTPMLPADTSCTASRTVTPQAAGQVEAAVGTEVEVVAGSSNRPGASPPVVLTDSCGSSLMVRPRTTALNSGPAPRRIGNSSPLEQERY